MIRTANSNKDTFVVFDFVGNKKQNLDELAARQYQIRLQTDTALAGEMRIEYGIKNT